VAAIDVGTNSVHLLVADVGADGEISVVEKSREQVELGRGSLNGNRLTDEAIERGVAALVSFKQATDLLNVETIEAAATSAVREAKNGSEFCRIVREQTGIHVRRIDGADEARLVWLGVRPDLDLSRGPALVADIGGGSVELVLGDAHGILAAHSLPLGHIRLSERYVGGDPPDIEEIRAVRNKVRSKVEPVVAAVPAGLPGPFVGTSGSIRTLARMATMMRGHPEPVDEHGLVLERLELKELLVRFTELPRAKLADLPGMDPRRKATLPAAAAVLYQLMKSFGREHIVTSERSLRDGLLADWIERHRPELTLQRTVSQPRMRAVVRMQERFEVDQEHAEQVRGLAVSLFDGLAELHGLGVDARRLLEFASLVHDVGHHIDSRDHNKHGHYLILHSRLPAFTAPEIAILANVVKYHRGARPKRSNRQFASLNRVSQRTVEVLSAILRLADALDRSQHQPVREVRVQIDEAEVTIQAVAHEDAFLERWAAERRAGVLGSVIGRPVRVVLVQDGPASRPVLAATADQVQ
jgi:exopolyphosphatase/guanosine-5'-triphosphate,3'-diphosphate pyrophosphatase